MKRGHSAECTCSFCESELKKHCVEPEFCQPCSVEFAVCRKCGKKYSRTLVQCPACGTSAAPDGKSEK